MKILSPITLQQQKQVLQKTQSFIHFAAETYNKKISNIPIYFDLKGRAAGMYVSEHKNQYIRYNPYIFAKYFDDNLQTTVPHEVAHYISDVLYGLRNIRPHGSEWKNIMLTFDAEPNVTSDYDLTGIPIRQLQRFEYQCGCMTHQLTAIRHNKMMQGKVSYRCKYCGSPVVFCE
ncbi:MAG: SprT-like domain-containing protein [Gammaproteobacteria bacterium]|nr:SprT-like domain-containing protein [Gammaproteobacteria bacterium]MCW8910842.1 SprT-like domain-containing protein [Gammaproteobacteria bacterium]MCW9005049.1 SprT-like domain-containing protein [Gammaproteobacteria bacterium]MCW9055737.1 SprT-like domain-containing protein [Gammaproteobacteria bacterium]